jgi:hypothetical protein
MYIISTTWRSSHLVPGKAIKARYTHKLLPLHIAFTANYRTGVGFRLTNPHDSFLVFRLDEQIVISDDIAPSKGIRVPNWLCIGIFFISVTEVWEMLICLYLCNGHTGNMKVLDCKLSWLMINLGDIVLPPRIGDNAQSKLETKCSNKT